MQGTTSVIPPFDSHRQQSDRRKLPRRSISGGAMAVFTDGAGPGRLTHVELIDASWTGLGLRSPAAVEPGASVSIMPDAALMPRQTGIVVRCDHDADGYRIGVRCKVAKAVA